MVEFDQSAGGVLGDTFDDFGVEHHSLDKPSEEDDSESVPTLADLTGLSAALDSCSDQESGRDLFGC